MKQIKKILFTTSLFFVLFSCSKDTVSSLDDSEIVKENEIVRYESTPNADNQLLTETYIVEDDATTFFYGSTDANGDVLSIESIAFKENNSNEVYYFLLDNFQRVTQIYSEVNGIKNSEVQYFYYPEPGLVNYVLAERNWATQENAVLHFSTVEIDEGNFNYNTLIGKSSKIKGVFWDTIVSNLIVVGTVSAAAITIVVVANGVSIISAVTAAVLFTGAAFANEPPVTNINPNAPNPPKPTLAKDLCKNSNLRVIIGVDPGNELYAIVSGSSSYYNFYWSTGEKDTQIISSHITAPDSGTYYVLVEDNVNGCFAFASTKPIIEPVGWYRGSYILTHVETLSSNANYKCGKQDERTGEFYVYIAKLGTETKVAVYAKSVIPDLPNIYTMASFIYNQLGYNNTEIDPLPWRNTYGFSFNPTTSSNTFYTRFAFPSLKLNETTNSLERIVDHVSEVVDNVNSKVEPTTNNIDCGFFDANGNHLYSYEYFYRFKDASASFVGIIPPNELTDYELANMEMILFDNDINRFSSDN
jgi:hypothetical protein